MEWDTAGRGMLFYRRRGGACCGILNTHAPLRYGKAGFRKPLCLLRIARGVQLKQGDLG